MGQDPQCIFCKIVRGEAAAVRVWEDDGCVAFMDLFPAAEGHALVVAKDHFASLLDSDAGAVAAVAVAARRIARALDKALKPDGIRVAQFNGAAAGQTVFHYHVHLIPAWAGAPVRLHGRAAAAAADLEAVAARIRAAAED